MIARPALVVALVAAAPAGAATVTPPAGTGGWHRGPVELRLDTAGEYRLDDGPWSPARPGQAVRVARDGVHTLEERAGEEAVRRTFARIDGRAPGITVTRTRGRRRVQLRLSVSDALAGAQRYRVRFGRGRWRARSLEDVLFDGTAASLARWRQAGGGSFELRPDGTLRTVGGLGLLWFAEREFADAALRLQWREARADGVASNAGVFVRFPGPVPVRECDTRLPLALYDFAWHAVACGHELQINDGDADPQRTGSVYAFRPLGPDDSPRAPFGDWNDYEVRTVGGGDYEITIARNGRLINRFVNTPGQRPSTGAGSPSSLYPGTEFKQFASGFVGLQNHGDADVVEFRDVRVLPLEERSATLSVERRRRTRTVRLRAVDAAGNRSRVVRVPVAAR